MDRKSNDSSWSNASQSDIWGQIRNTDTLGTRQTRNIVISKEVGGRGEVGTRGEQER